MIRLQFINFPGTQSWADGSCYHGEFLNDLRHGEGHHTWANGEVSSNSSDNLNACNGIIVHLLSGGRDCP